MSLKKRKPYRNPALLRFAKGQSCIRCGVNDGTIVAAHYSGIDSSVLGKGMGQKSDDFCTAHFCSTCHTELDQYMGGNSEGRAVDFLIYILQTLRRALDAGVLK